MGCMPSRLMKPIVSSILGTVFYAQSAVAGGFSLYTEGSVSELGVFAAGSAAQAPDASIGWYNPAGLVLIPEDSLVVSGVGVLPHTTLSGTSTYQTEGFLPYVQSFNRLNGGQSAVVPAIHLAHPLGERAVFGFSLVTPFGLSTDWGERSALRYAGTFTELLTVVASPEIGGYINEHVSIGAGLDLEWARVTFNAVAGSPAALQYLQLSPTMLDSTSTNRGHSFGIGFHTGLLTFFNDEHTRIGFNFQSAISHEFNGTSKLKGRLADLELMDPNAIYQLDTLYSNDIRLPNISTLSFYQDVTYHWALLGSVVYTGWHVFNKTELHDVAGFDIDESMQAPISITTEQRYRNAWRFALGALYDFNERWTWRFGAGYDQTPTINAERDSRLPDMSRWAIATGLHYQPYTSLGIDFAYVYLWGAGRTPVHKTQVFDALSSVRVDAWGSNYAQLVGLQAVWKPLN